MTSLSQPIIFTLFTLSLVGCNIKAPDNSSTSSNTATSTSTSTSGGGSSGSGGSNTSTKKTTDTDTSVSFLALSFPSDLAVVSPLAPVSSGATLLDDASTTPIDYSTQVSNVNALLSATDMSACTFILSKATNSPNCYGPSLDFKGHPDYTSGGSGPGQQSADGNFPGGDLGIWTKYANSNTDSHQESCVSSKTNSLIGTAAAFVGNGEMAMAFLQCVAKVSNLVIPKTKGDSLDVLSSITSNSDIATDFTYSAASITYSDDYTLEDGSTTPIYLSTMTFASDTDKVTYTINLKHTTTDTTNNFYRGKFWLFATPASGNNTMQKTGAYSLIYEKTDAATLSYSLRTSNFVTTATETDMFDDDKTVKTPASNDGYSWGIFQVNPSDGTGKVGYAWVAGTTNENARTFLSSVTTDSDGIKSGVGYFGFGDSMNNIISEYKDSGTFTKFLDRMVCNWAGPGNQHTGVPYLQRQIIAQNDAGIFEPTESKITYVPRNSCGTGSGENNSTFTYRTSNTTDSYTAFGTPDLVSITTEKTSTYSDTFVIPTPPKEF